MRVHDKGLELFDVKIETEIPVTVWPDSRDKETFYRTNLKPGQIWKTARVQDLASFAVVYFTSCSPFDTTPYDGSPLVVVQACIKKQ